MRDSTRGIAGFLASAFGFTWILAGIGALLGIRADSGISYLVLAGACMLGPAVGAVVQARLREHRSWSWLGLGFKVTDWRIVAFTAVAGISIMPLYLLVQHLLGDGLGFARFGHVSFTPERMAASLSELAHRAGVEAGQEESLLAGWPPWLVLAIIQFAALLSACSVNLLFMLGEELGWRGYLWRATAHWSGLRRIAFTGAAWGLWHAPLILMGHNYPGFPWIGVAMMVAFCALAAILFDWTRIRSGSIWSSALLHGIINGSAGGVVLFAWGGHPLWGSPVGVAGFIALATLALVVLLFDARYRKGLLVAVGDQPAP